MIRTFTIQLTIVLFIAVSMGSAQFEHLYENWRWAHFTTKTGLPSDYVEDIVETKDGNIWISTYKGIAWYDGFRWNKVIVDSMEPDQRVRLIEAFYDDKIFVILSGSLFIGNKHGFQKFIFDSYPKDGIVSSVCSVDSNTIFCTFEYADSVILLKIQNGIVQKPIAPPPGKLFKTASTIWYLAEGKDNRQHLYEIRNGNFIEVISPLSHPNAIRNIVANKKGEGVIAIDAPKHNIGLWEYDKYLNMEYSRTEKNQPVRALDISDDGEVFVIYESGEIHIRYKGKWENIDPMPKQLMNVVSVRYRDNNDLWLGTENGLYLFSRRPNLWKSNKTSFSDLRNVIMEIFQSSNGDVWVGTMNGVEVYKPNSQKSVITSIHGKEIGLVTGINEDENKHIWISTGAGFKGAFEWTGTHWIHHQIYKANINYHKIRKDKRGNLWFLGLGVKNEDPAGHVLSNGKFLRIDSLYSLPSNRIYAFGESRLGTLWFGTNNGLTRIKKGSIKNWGHESFGRNAKVYTLAIDNEENVWFSTFSAQLYTVSKSDSIIWVWRDDELYNYKQKVWDLSFDNSGILWVATTRGLFSNHNSVWSNYSYETGVNIRELRVVLPTLHRIYVGGHGIGLRIIERKKTGYPIKIFVNKPIVETNDVHISWQAIAYWGMISPDQIETRYKINSDVWSSWSTDRNIIVASLNSGKYRFQVQAKDSYGYIHNDADIVSFEIEPPLLFRPFFYIPILCMGIIVMFTLWRYFNERQNNVILIQNQRTRIANDLHDEIGSNLGSIALISQQISKNESLIQQIKDELAIITATSLETAEFLRDIVWYINPRYDTFMNLEARLREISGRMMRDIEVQFIMNDDVSPEAQFIESRRNIILMFKEILHNIMKHSQATKVEVRCERNMDTFQLSVRDNGVGFNPELEAKGNGLLSLKRRADEIGATLTTSSRKGEGTRIHIMFKTNVNTL